MGIQFHFAENVILYLFQELMISQINETATVNF